jgi:MerR family transcriptional regulator, redox-sensitive transcriptional activator SoxR
MAATHGIEVQLTVGQLARASGVAASAVRFYEAHGLITGERTTGNQRRFTEPDVCRIKVIRVAQRVGLTVAEIRAHLDSLPAEPSPNDWRLLTEQLVAEAQARIRQLTAVLEDIVTADKLCELPPAGMTPLSSGSLPSPRMQVSRAPEAPCTR